MRDPGYDAYMAERAAAEEYEHRMAESAAAEAEAEQGQREYELRQLGALVGGRGGGGEHSSKEGAMEAKDITVEEWREYDYGGRVYRIAKPQKLWIGTTTHRVLDAEGIVHCVPAPGFNGCVLRWKGPVIF